jgi:hypothetical protein
MDQNNRHSTPTKNQAVLQHSYLLPNIYYEKMELDEICLTAKSQPSSSHYIQLSRVKKIILVK